ncbi:hypothetical protein QJQ45_017138, partial [Haematococcus lacustris]
RTSRVSLAVNGQQPCEEQPCEEQRTPTRPAGWEPPAGQVDHGLMSPAWRQQRDPPVQGLKWCPAVAPCILPQPPEARQPHRQKAEHGPSTPLPVKRSKRTKAKQAAESTQPTQGRSQGMCKAVKAKTAPHPGRWVDRDCNAALNVQRSGKSRWHPLELCWWPDLPELLATGREYPGLGYKWLRDRAPSAAACGTIKGTLEDWDFSEPGVCRGTCVLCYFGWRRRAAGHNYTHITLATATNFTAYNASTVGRGMPVSAIPFIMQVFIMLTLTLIMHPAMQSTAFTPGAIPFWPLTNKSAPLLIVGTVEVSSVQWCSVLCGCEFQCLPAGLICLPTAKPLHGQQMPGDRSLEPICSALRPCGADLGLATGDDGAPFSGQKVYAYAFTGTCERGVVDLFRHNATLGDARGNLLWWRNGVTSSNGTLWGTAPNILLPRRPGTQPNGAASILIVPPPQFSECSLWSSTMAGGPFCANFVWAPPADEWLAAAVANCTRGYMPPHIHRHRKFL